MGVRLCGDGTSVAGLFRLRSTVTALKRKGAQENTPELFYCSHFFISEIVLFNILNKILKNKCLNLSLFSGFCLFAVLETEPIFSGLDVSQSLEDKTIKINPISGQ